MTSFLRNYAGVLIVLILATILAKTLLLGGAQVISLGPAPPLAGTLSQSLAASHLASGVPQAGRDYQLRDVTYYSDRGWAAARIIPLHNQGDPSVVVLQKINGTYRVVLGPGTEFSTSQLQHVPAAVATYISNYGAVHESVQ